MHAVLGVGEPLTRALGRSVPGLRAFPGLTGAGCAAPSTQSALWLMIRGEQRSEVFDRSARLVASLEPAFAVEDAIDTFVYEGGRDLTGYVDGTENPKLDAAEKAALVASGAGLQGGSFAAVQRWVHDLRQFGSFSKARRDATIGRELESNEELADAPSSAHVKRSAQESFDPTAFMLRRSMPWTHGMEQGLEFVAYGASLDAYERVLRRMLGLDDGVVDALFSFARPVSGGYYFCPPLTFDSLDLRCLGLG